MPFVLLAAYGLIWQGQTVEPMKLQRRTVSHAEQAHAVRESRKILMNWGEGVDMQHEDTGLEYPVARAKWHRVDSLPQLFWRM